MKYVSWLVPFFILLPFIFAAQWQVDVVQPNVPWATQAYVDLAILNISGFANGSYLPLYGPISSLNATSQSIALGYFASATGSDSTAFGPSAHAPGDFASSIGYLTYANGYGSFAGGYRSQANGNFSVSLGTFTESNGKFSTALGSYTYAEGEASTAMGQYSNASGFGSTAGGYTTKATNYYATAFGLQCISSGFASFAIGNNAWALGDNSVAIGDGVVSEGNNSITMGQGITGTENNSFNVGFGNLDFQITNHNVTSLGTFTVDDGYYYEGDGSHLTGVIGDNISWNQEFANGLYNQNISKIYIVDADGKGDFTDLQDALNASIAAGGGVEIRIMPGNYSGNFVLAPVNASVGDITIVGSGASTILKSSTGLHGDAILTLGTFGDPAHYLNRVNIKDISFIQDGGQYNTLLRFGGGASFLPIISNCRFTWVWNSAIDGYTHEALFTGNDFDNNVAGSGNTMDLPLIIDGYGTQSKGNFPGGDVTYTKLPEVYTFGAVTIAQGLRNYKYGSALRLYMPKSQPAGNVANITYAIPWNVSGSHDSLVMTYQNIGQGVYNQIMGDLLFKFYNSSGDLISTANLTNASMRSDIHWAILRANLTEGISSGNIERVEIWTTMEQSAGPYGGGPLLQFNDMYLENRSLSTHDSYVLDYYSVDWENVNVSGYMIPKYRVSGLITFTGNQFRIRNYVTSDSGFALTQGIIRIDGISGQSSTQPLVFMAGNRIHLRSGQWYHYMDLVKVGYNAKYFESANDWMIDSSVAYGSRSESTIWMYSTLAQQAVIWADAPPNVIQNSTIGTPAFFYPYITGSTSNTYMRFKGVMNYPNNATLSVYFPAKEAVNGTLAYDGTNLRMSNGTQWLTLPTLEANNLWTGLNTYQRNVVMNANLSASANTLESCAWEGNSTDGAICSDEKIMAGYNETSKEVYCCEI